MNNLRDDRLDELIKIPKLNFLSKLSKSLIIISPNVEKYQNDENQIDYNGKKISMQLLIDILSHDDSYELVEKMYKNESPSFCIFFIGENGEYISQYNFDKKSFLNTFDKIIFNLPEDLLEKHQQLAKSMSFDNYIDNHIEDTYNIEIDGKNYDIKVSDIINFLKLDSSKYDEIMSNESGLLFGIPKSEFIYAVSCYFKENKIVNNYVLDELFLKRLTSIDKSEQIDIEAYNKFNSIDDFNFENICVNEELKNYILNDIPQNLNTLEKAIYVYIKMCKTLTYDEEFYAMKQSGPVVFKHEDIDNVSQIGLKNNKVVCYEFNAIYEKMLAELKINFTTEQKLLNGFGGGHANLTFRVGKFIIEADSVTSILGSDMTQAKLNQPLHGLNCKNKNEETQQEFKKMVNKIYSLIASKEEKKTLNEVETTETFEDILQQYQSQTNNLQPVSISEKVNILVEKVNSTQMLEMDSLSYVLQLRKVLFTEQERRDNFRISIVRDSGVNNSNQYASANAIFALRLPNEDKKMTVNYYFYTPGQKLKQLKKSELQTMFDDDKIGYVANDDPKVPGIK